MADYYGHEITIYSKVKETYSEIYPNDIMVGQMREDVTYAEVLAHMVKHSKKFYETVFKDECADSITRENIFAILAFLTDVNYEVIYDLWLLGYDYTMSKYFPSKQAQAV